MPTLRDCVYGQAVADALGVPYEFSSAGPLSLHGHGRPRQPQLAGGHVERRHADGACDLRQLP